MGAMIVDSHYHIFPFLGSAGGYSSVRERMRIMQLTMKNAQPRRRSDGAIVVEPTLWDGKTEGFEGLLDVNFRAGKYGRYEWDRDGETYYTEGFPPSLQDNEASPDYMVAQMDFVGVDVAVLQNDFLYGYLNEYFAEAVRQHPDRLVGTVKVREPEAFRDEQIRELHRCVGEYGFRGVFFQKSGFRLAGSDDRVDDPMFRPFWDEVRKLGVMVYFHGFFEEWRQLAAVAERYADVPMVHTIPTWNFPRDGIGRTPREGRVHIRQ